MSKPIIVVFTATGKTGGGFIDAVLKDGSFTPRAVTRNPDSDAAKALAARGVEVVKADLSEPASLGPVYVIQSINNNKLSLLTDIFRMKGAYGVLGVTDFWQAFFAEEQQGTDMVDAAKAAGIEHFVWTTLEHSKVEVPHWETKARVDDYLKSTGMPRTSVYTSFFHENIGNPAFSPIKVDKNTGKALIDWPFKTDGPIGMIYANDIGVACLEAFKHPDQWIGKYLLLLSTSSFVFFLFFFS
ncbi:NmrA-like domain-containing protein 1 [Serendipita sp. 398]|nr:NmrA-like domain-containing protein 1 [Serendipita sp. 398]